MFRKALRVLFFFSGALALGYQTLWSKMLLDFIGVSAYSYATVLAAFMGGLAIGSWLLGRKADTIRSPLKLYAYLELGIGLYAVLFPVLINWAASQYSHWVIFSAEQSGATFRLGTKVIVSGILLVPPAALMGGTYPALLRQTTRMRREIGQRASEFYAINCFGAVCGTLIMAFLLMPTLGISACLMSLALGNVIIGMVAFVLSWLAELNREPFFQTPQESSAPIPSPDRVRLVLTLILIEGFLVFCYEIAWTRYFGLLLGSSTYSFAVMLAAFITGIALGSSWLHRRQNSIRHPLEFLGWTQMSVGIFALIFIPMYPFLPWFFSLVSDLLSASRGAFYVYEVAKFLLCYLIMLGPTIFIGMAVPLAIQGIGRSVKTLGRDIGRLYAWNTTGNVLGSLSAGLILLPLLGMERFLRWTAVGSALLGVVITILFSAETKKSKRVWRYAIAAVVILGIQLFSSEWDARWFTLMPARRAVSGLSFVEAKRLLSTQTMLLFHDDPAAHIMVVEYPEGNVKQRGLFVNGKPDASTSDDMITQVLLGQLPLLMHPQTKDVLIIGLASGVTCGSVLTHGIQRADTVELVQSMPQATRLFQAWNRDPFSDPRFHLITDDARSYVTLTRQKYDVIISEPSNPWTAGTGSLFSSDFYRHSLTTLREDGIYVQWLQSYEMSNETFAAVVRSFRSVYPFVYGFQAAASDLILIGSRQPIHPDWREMQNALSRPPVHEDLHRVRADSLAGLLYLQRFSSGTVDYIGALSDRENNDDNRLLEYEAPRDLFQRFHPTYPEHLDERLQSSPYLFWSEYARLFPDQIDPQGTLRLLGAGRVGSPLILSTYQLATTHWSDQQGFSINGSPLPQSEWMERLSASLKKQDGQTANSILDSMAPSIFLQTVLSPDQGNLWVGRAKQWAATAPRFERFTEFAIELQMAVGDKKDASAELLQWVNSRTPPPENWAILRAAQWNEAGLLHRVIDRYAKIQPSLFLMRLKELTQQN